MWRATASQLLTHKVRLGLTTLAVVLGVAFVTGTSIFTDTVRASFDSVFQQITANVDLSVRGVAALGQSSTSDPFTAPRPVVPPAIADRVTDLDGVAAVERNVEGFAQLVDRNGEPIGDVQTAPTLGANAPTSEALTPNEIRDGRYPSTSDEVAIDAATAAENAFAVGDVVEVVAGEPVTSYEIVGVFGFGDGVDDLAGASLVLFEPDTAYELFSRDGGYDSVDVLADDDTEAAALGERIAAAIGDDYEVVTNAQLAAESEDLVGSFLDLFSAALFVFAAVSLLVGAFIINNTFTIIVAQRSRDLGLLRAIGASRRQVLGSVLLEGLIVGAIGALLGVAVGAAVAVGLRSVLAGFGIEFPDAELVVTLRTVGVGIALGVVVTFLSALRPALTALRVPPIAALRAVVPAVRRGGVLRTVFGALVTVAGLGLLSVGLFGDGGMPVVGVGAVLLLMGAALLARFVVRPLLRLIGWPLTRLGVRGQLARENAIRSPQRTASTASALMIGLGLVTFALIFGASIRQSTTAAIDEQLAADFLINARGPSFPAEVARELRDVDGIDTVTAEHAGQIAVRELDDRISTLAALDPDRLDAVYTIDVVDGDLADFADGGLLLHEDIAADAGVGAGDALTVTFPDADVDQIPVRALFAGESSLTGQFVLDEDTFEEHYDTDVVMMLHLRLADGVGAREVRPDLEAAIADFPTLVVQDQQQVKEEITTLITSVLGLISALLALSIFIALFGIANTLSLSVFERVRELGLLRAVGATRRQVRSIIRWESVLIAVLGAMFGVVVGTVFGWMAVQSLAGQGFSTFAFPTGQLITALILSGLAGVLAAVPPARRAARVDLLRALTVG